ncbi:hypothetical protein [Catenulispora rubra]|uniref:hypothetical protein n=1 Tax=Catenulispora rubra TaxID=280293 RepID=UPI001891FEB3|nr:hypothetical protein [Catenulispora rubra]
MATRPPIGFQDALAAFGRFEAETGGGTGGAAWFGGPTGPGGDEGPDEPAVAEVVGVVGVAGVVGALGPAVVEDGAAGAVVEVVPALVLVPATAPMLETELAAESPAAL